MTSPLTIGMATHTDFEGVWATLQALDMYHPRVEYMVVDNAPVPCFRTRNATHAVGGTYTYRPDLTGTAAPRDGLFRFATTEWVMCVDSHIFLELGAVESLLDYIKQNPKSNDLIQGPIVWDNGVAGATHWRQTKPPGLWGVWDTFPCWMQDEPFEIPMQGLGIFAMRKEAWPGFNPFFRGFGGEEGYIHEKVRKAGGRCLCLPHLLWRHRSRDGTQPPYPLTREDHVWNLLIGHRELGIDATEEIKEDFPIPKTTFAAMKKEVDSLAMGESKRLQLLGVWYSNNSAPHGILRNSLKTIRRAQQETRFHDVDIATSTWHALPDNPFPCHVEKPASNGHAAILSQIETCMGLMPGKVYDGVVFLEHDVLYPPNHFDRMGSGLLQAEIVSNLNYEGLNRTGWLKVKERHEPLHQFAMRWGAAIVNLSRAKEDCAKQGWAYLEPQSDRGRWFRYPYTKIMPSIHINHPCGRFTSHGDVCYEASSGGQTVHPFWGNFKEWWC